MLDCGGQLGGASDPPGRLLTSDEHKLIATRFPDSWKAPFASGVRLPIEIDRFSQTVVGLKVAVAPEAKPGRATVHLVQRRAPTSQIVGGVAVQVNVRDP